MTADNDNHDDLDQLDEVDLRLALHDALDGTEPPTHPELDGALAKVLAKGQRRVRSQRLLAAFGVVAMVIGVAVAASALRPAGQSDVPAAATGPLPTAVTTRPSGLAVTPTPVTGWQPVSVPLHLASFQEPNSDGSPAIHTYCAGPGQKGPVPGPGPIPGQQVFMPGLAHLVQQVSPDVKVGLVSTSWSPNIKDQPGSAYGEIVLDVDQGTHRGMLTLEVLPTMGTPTANADSMAAVITQCTLPLRQHLSNGIVLQLNAPDTPAEGTASEMAFLFSPKGYAYTVTMVGDGTPGTRPDGTTGASWLPLGRDQFAKLMQGLASLP